MPASVGRCLEEELGPILAPGEVVPEPETLGWNDDTEAYVSDGAAPMNSGPS